MTTAKQLTEALNLICEYVEINLAPEWSIELHMHSGEAWMELYDQDGNLVETDTDTGTLDGMCSISQEPQ